MLCLTKSSGGNAGRGTDGKLKLQIVQEDSPVPDALGSMLYYGHFVKI